MVSAESQDIQKYLEISSEFLRVSKGKDWTYPVMTHGTWAKALKSDTKTGMAVATIDWSSANIYQSVESSND
jgi:hypothetical protein